MALHKWNCLFVLLLALVHQVRGYIDCARVTDIWIPRGEMPTLIWNGERNHCVTCQASYFDIKGSGQTCLYTCNHTEMEQCQDYDCDKPSCISMDKGKYISCVCVADMCNNITCEPEEFTEDNLHGDVTTTSTSKPTTVITSLQPTSSRKEPPSKTSPNGQSGSPEKGKSASPGKGKTTSSGKKQSPTPGIAPETPTDKGREPSEERSEEETDSPDNESDEVTRGGTCNTMQKLSALIFLSLWLQHVMK